MDLKRTALYEEHIKLGAKIVPFAGFEMPVRYQSEIEEHHAVRNHVGVFDVSHMGEFLIKGPQSLELIQRITSNDASKLYPGKVQYSCLPNETGGIVDDLFKEWILKTSACCLRGWFFTRFDLTNGFSRL